VCEHLDLDPVLASLVVAVNCSVPSVGVSLVVEVKPLLTNLLPCVDHNCTSIALCWGKLHRPVESAVVDVNKNMKIIKEIPANDHIVGIQPYDQHWQVVDPAAIDLNIEQQVLRDGGSFGSIISLRIDRVGKLLRLQPEGSAEVGSKGGINKNITTCSSITKGVHFDCNSILM
jgi:hypothetical protein